MQQTGNFTQQSHIPSRHAPMGISESNGSCVVVAIDVAVGPLGNGFGEGPSGGWPC